MRAASYHCSSDPTPAGIEELAAAMDPEPRQCRRARLRPRGPAPQPERPGPDQASIRTLQSFALRPMHAEVRPVGCCNLVVGLGAVISLRVDLEFKRSHPDMGWFDRFEKLLEAFPPVHGQIRWRAIDPQAEAAGPGGHGTFESARVDRPVAWDRWCRSTS